MLACKERVILDPYIVDGETSDGVFTTAKPVAEIGLTDEKRAGAGILVRFEPLEFNLDL